MSSRIFISLAVVAVTALLGVSIARVDSADPWPMALGGAVIGAVAAGIGALFQEPTAALEKAIPRRKLLGMRIAVVGFVIALGGWLVAVFLSKSAGYWIAMPGIFLGIVGLCIHVINLIPRSD